jgi:hypothetical protein
MTLNVYDPYLAYYKHQLGSGVSVVYKGSPYQRGHGIGSFLGGLFRTITPLLRSGVKTVGKEALMSGVNVLKDVINAVPPDQALSSRVKEFTGNLKRKADEKIDRVIMGGSGYKKKRINVTPQSLKRLLAVHQVKKRRVPSKKSLKRKVSKSVVNKKDIFG